MYHFYKSTCSALAITMLLLLFSVLTTQAQIAVADTLSDDDLVQTLTGEGVLIGNINIDCADGAYGQFVCENCNVGLEAGIVLTTGPIEGVLGPNDSGGEGMSMGTPGDPDLEAIIGGDITNDACILTLDIEAASDTITFNYVFGSDEYLEFVGSFNDVFAFFISGPGITGQQNIALIPGTTTPVSINNVNDFANSEYYVNNGDGFSPPQSTDPYYIQYDGFTTVLQARAAVIPCETYTLKLAVADALDGVLDSGVFIEAGSIRANKASVNTTTELAGLGFENAVEGCINGIINFNLDFSIEDTTVITFALSGDAVNGVDFEAIPDSIVILPGDTSAQLVVTPIDDDLNEGIETLNIHITNAGLCASAALDSAVIKIQDNIVAQAFPSVVQTCPGTEIQLLSIGGIECVWEPALYLDNPISCAPTATPLSSITYAAITNVGSCVDTAYVTINIDDDFAPMVVAQVEICDGATAQLNASGGSFYVWEPADDLSCTDCPDPVYSGSGDASYTVTILDDLGCSFTGTVEVLTGSIDLGFDEDSHVICVGDSFDLDVGIPEADTYVWSPIDGLSCSDCPNPVASPTSDITYTVVAASGFCMDMATVSFTLSESFANAGEDMTSCQTLEAVLGADAPIEGFDYNWSPITNLDDATVAQPNFFLDTEGLPTFQQVYELTVTDSIGCTATDEVSVTVEARPDILIEDVDILEGEEATLFADGVHPNSAFVWSPAEGLNGTTSQSVTASPSETTTYTVTATTPTGCITTAEVTVTVNPVTALMVPTAFSPNQDGKNDLLRVVTADFIVHRFEVFNRWGTRMYQQVGNDGIGWDGIYEGEQQPMGVYVFFVQYSEPGSQLVKLLKGNVTLIR